MTDSALIQDDINPQKSGIGPQSYEGELCLVKQVNTISFFYFINIIADLILYFLGNDAITDGDILCARDRYLIVHNEMGAMFMLFYSVYILVYSSVMWYVFY